jgi:hypothetical protein
VLPALLLKAGDAWSTWVLQESTGGQFTQRLVSVLTLGGSTPSVVVVLGVIAIIISAVQAVLMLFRQGALIVLAGVLPLAAAGMLTPATRRWFPRLTGWMMALIFYKPAAAMVYATAFTMIGTGKDPRTVLMGFAMVFLSLLALPVLMRLFTWTTGHVADSSGGGFLQTALQGAVAIGALRGMSGGAGGSGPVEQARMVSSRLGPADSGPAGASSSGAGARPGTTPGMSSGTSGSPVGSAAAAPAARAGAPSGAAASGASAGSAAAAGAAGPAGIAVAGLAAGAGSASRTATEAMQPPGTPGGDQ